MREEFEERSKPRGLWPRKKVKEFKSKKDVEKNCLLCSAFDIKCRSSSRSRWYLKFDRWIKQKI